MNCKKVLACITSLLICCGALATPQVADVVSSSILVHADSSGFCGDRATYFFDSSTGTLSISGNGAMKNYTTSSSPWYSYRNLIKKVVINNGITSIAIYSFDGCISLTNIIIPDSVTFIGAGAFYNCSSLTNITIPNSVTIMGNYMFWGCKSLKSITISNNIECIRNYDFYGCTSLESITIPSSVTSIEYSAFNGCTSLKDVYFNDTEKEWNNISIGGNNDSLNDATIHYESMGSCGDNATWFFDDSTGTLTISGTGAMKDYSYSSNTPWYNYKDLITDIVIEDGITYIGDYSFSNCIVLKNIDIPNSVISIGYGAFEFCTSLESINLPSNLEFIGEKNFNGCESLENIIIPDSIKKIYNNTFNNCISLSSITISKKVTSIEYSAFNGCTSLTDVYFQGTEGEWNNISISGYNEPLNNATIHYIKDNTMIFGEDNWNFTNSNMYFGMEGSKIYISSKDKSNLLKSLSNTERVRMVKYLKNAWQGSCYGMSITELLAKVGIFNVNDWDSSADTLNELSVLDPQENSAEESLINYYQLLQVTDLIQQEISNTITNRKDYDVVAELLDMVSEVENGGNPVLVCYSGNGFAHAVVAYGVEDDYKVINGIKYDKKILVMDSNFGNQFNNDACIYVNSSSNRWCIPYSEYNLNSDDNYTRIILATNDLELINNKGYFETPEEYLSGNQYISVLEFNYNTDFNISKTIESGNGNWINSTQNGVPEGELFYGFFANDTAKSVTAKTTLKDSLSGYSYSIDSPNEMDLNMSYKNCYLTISADNSYNVKFAPKGYIEMDGENSSYSMNMVFNNGYYTLPWSNIQIDGRNVNNISMDKTNDGIVISSDNLTNVKVSGISDDVFTKVTFSTEYDKALVYAIDDYTIGIKVDKDNNGTFETVLTKSKGYNKVKDFSIVGDVNSDNQVSSMDLLLIKRHILDMGIDLSDMPQSDINEDSCVDLLDLLELKKYIIE